MSVLVIGSRGMLGKLLISELQETNYQVITASIDDPTTDIVFDFSNREETELALRKFRPAVVVNCAAYTAVDKAETDAVNAIKANIYGPKNLAKCAEEFGYRLIHISTDYVYGEVKERAPLSEETQPAPCGVYGHTKYLGDELILSHARNRAAILRTAWLHAETGPNFVATIRRIAAEKEEIKIVSDQIGSPTYAGWLARTIVNFIPKFSPGVFHATNRGEISWFQFAQKICELSGLKTKVLPQTTAELNRPAPRPAYSALSCKKLEQLLSLPCQSWEEGLEEHLSKLDGGDK